MKRFFKKKKDPHAAREASNYAQPIASREHLITVIREFNGRPKVQDIALILKYKNPVELDALRRRLRAMVRDAQLNCTQDGCYYLMVDQELVVGEVIINKDGFAKLLVEDRDGALRIPPRYANYLLPGDKVQARIAGPGARGRLEAIIITVLEHRVKTIVGRFYDESGGCYVVPEDPRINHEILVLPGGAEAVEDEQLVMIEVAQYPDKHHPATGRITGVFGHQLTAALLIDEAIETFQIPNEWPAPVEKQVAKIADHVTKSDLKGRKDLRELPFVTIDGEDARDFDDAVYCEPVDEGGWRLYVAIADVSHYVQATSPLDKEAQKRGNSVYFPERVVPMLPEKLSNGLCSLNPHVDRLVMVAEVVINAKGKRKRYRFYPAVIQSQGRLTYDYVAAYLQKKALPPKPEVGDELSAQTCGNVDRLHALFKALYKSRQARGAIEFDTVEPIIQLDDNGRVADIKLRQRNVAHQLIEECMLQANVAAADCILSNDTAGLYRVHRGLKPGKLEELRAFLNLRGLKMAGGEGPTPEDFNAVLQAIRERDDREVIQSVMLRSLTQAEYREDNIGHFGLAYDAYTHFTSPIRRYADLIVHRVIKKIVDKKSAAGERYDEEKLHQIGMHISVTERRADEATRDVVATLKCLYIESHLGKVLTGVISGVTNFGFFVTLDGLFVDGLVHIAGIDKDYYQFDERAQQLVGKRSNRRFGIGQKVTVQLAQVNTAERKVDFKLCKDAP